MKKYSIFLYLLALIEQFTFEQNPEKTIIWNYPEFKPDTANDDYYGKKVVDPFRNLENLEYNQVNIWLNRQNKFYDNIMPHISCRKALQKEITKMRNAQKKWTGFARTAGSRIFYVWGHMKDDIESLSYSDSLNQEPIALFNTKKINKKSHTVFTIDYYEPSFDGRYLAFGISAGGSEKSTLYVLDVAKKELLPGQIEKAMLGNPQWLPDGTGFFYIQDKELLTEEDKKTPYDDPTVKLHLLGTDPKNDKEIFSRAVNKDLGLEKIDVPMLFTFLSSDKVIINIMKGTGQYYPVYYAGLDDVLYKPAENVQWEKICDNNEKMGSNVLYGNRFFGISYKSNPNGQLIMMTLPDKAPEVLFEGNGFSLDDMVINNNSLYITSLENGLNKLVQVDLENFHPVYIELPFQGGLHLRPFFPVVSFYQPGDNVIFGLTAFNKQWDMYISGTDKQVRKTNLSPETVFIRPPLNLIIEEVQVPSYDGTMVPLSIVYKKGIKSDGTNPTLIDAYGAYGYTYKSEFDRNRLAWFDHGGIFAVAHVRGGGEKGDNWYKGGFKATKPNSWKDLIACAEYLVKNNYTSPQKLAVTGASAGGITAGRAITERPELFKAAVIFVGDLNAVRMENTFNNTSVTEFGTVKDSLEFQYLYDMDTYHHIYEGVSYPSVLFTAGLNDSRVAAWEPAKAVARMQQVCKGKNIILFRIEDGGHYNYPSAADVYSFLLWQLGAPGVKFKPKKCVYKTIDK